MFFLQSSGPPSSDYYSGVILHSQYSTINHHLLHNRPVPPAALPNPRANCSASWCERRSVTWPSSKSVQYLRVCGGDLLWSPQLVLETIDKATIHNRIWSQETFKCECLWENYTNAWCFKAFKQIREESNSKDKKQTKSEFTLLKNVLIFLEFCTFALFYISWVEAQAVDVRPRRRMWWRKSFRND